MNDALPAENFSVQWVARRLAEHRARPIADELAPRRAAVAIVLRPGQQTPCCELLFIRRAEQRGDPWSGHMAFPGGGREPEDVSSLETARRETAEEVGLDLRRHADLLGRLDDVRASARGRVLPMAITPYVFLLDGSDRTRPNEEVQEVLWVPAGELLDPARRTVVPYQMGQQRFELPAIDARGRIIWGLTYQMLMRFFALLDWQGTTAAP